MFFDDGIDYMERLRAKDLCCLLDEAEGGGRERVLQVLGAALCELLPPPPLPSPTPQAASDGGAAALLEEEVQRFLASYFDFVIIRGRVSTPLWNNLMPSQVAQCGCMLCSLLRC